MYLDAVITKDNNEGLPELSGRIPRNYMGRVRDYQLSPASCKVPGSVEASFARYYELSLPNRISTEPYHRVDAVFFYRATNAMM